MTQLAGIDVSNWNGVFDWEPWRGKIAFAGVRISEGTTLSDQYAAHNVAGAHALGIPVIGYHFAHNGTGNQGGVQQAEWYLHWAHLAGLQPGRDLIAVDVEDGGLDIDLTKATAADVAQAYLHFDLVAAGFLNQIKEHWANYNAVVYTEISAAPSLQHCGQSPLWLADPSGTPETSIGPWPFVSFTQTGQRGVDTDTFHGNLTQLEALAIPAK